MTSAEPVDVLVVGGGPSGLAAATELRSRGIERVVVLEREQQAGGVPRHCGHPPFGMLEFKRVLTGPAYALALVRMATQAGVEIRTGHTVVSLEPNGHVNVSSDQEHTVIVAKRVILATGVRESPRSARLVSGDRPLGILNTGALQAYIHLHGLLPFRNPIIVGTELVSLSAILTCRSAGAKPVAVVERNHRPIARWPLNLAPKIFGIPVHFGAEIADIRGRRRVEAVDIRKEDGPLLTVACDGVLFTGGFIPEASLVQASHLSVDLGSGGPDIDQYGRCSDRSYFACGNVLRPVETAGWCFREGRLIGGLVADDLAGELPQTDRIVSIRCGSGIKLTVPQRLSMPMGRAGLPHLQLRIAKEFSGELLVKAGGQDIWKRSLCALPERRLLIPLSRIAIPDTSSNLTVGFDTKAGSDMPRVAAVDQGTTSTRILVLEDDGSAHIHHAVRHEQHFPHPGYVEHNPLELLGNISNCIQAAGVVDAIGLDNQGESCLAWDAVTGEPLTPVIVWQDNRTKETINRLRAAGAEALTLERAGLPLDAYFSASKLSWIVENVDAARQAMKVGRLRLGTTDAFFLDRLTGRHVTDVTTASRTSLMDIRSGKWDPELCELFRVPIEALPEIRPTVGEFGTVGATPLTASIVDQQAALFGHGCRSVGQAKITFGTGAFALALTGSDIVQRPDQGLLPTVAWNIGGRTEFALDGGVYNAGSAVEWARRIGLVDDISEFQHFERAPAIARGLAFVPALSGLACPHWDRSAAALWIGMSTETTRGDMCQALLEGVALRTAEVIAAMEAHVAFAQTISIDGGLTRSPYFIQFLADILGRPVLIRNSDELTALGCAELARHGLGYDIDRTRGEKVTRVDPGSADRDRWRAIFSEARSRATQWR